MVLMTNKFNSASTEQIAKINQIIDTYFEQSIATAESVGISYQLLWKHLQTLFKSGGKRMRPQMTMLSYEAFGGKDTTSMLPVAAAQELLHFSLLIHDDIIDRDYVRYGVANIAGQYDILYKPFISSVSERAHYVNSAALLGGDLMLSSAHQMIMTSTLPTNDKLAAQALLNQSVFEAAGGELLDMEASFTSSSSGDALRIAHYKTASYSFVTPLLTGARIAGADMSQQEIIRTFASALGVAYQLTDDILGVFGNEDKTGKSTSSDIREGKHTFLVERCLDRLNDHERALFDASFGNSNASPAAIAQIKELFETSGAKDITEQAILEHTTKAKSALQNLNINKRHLDIFEEIIARSTNRTT